ncbi:MAG: hypothetical protein P8M34_11695, partial [Saprospiraceae bacterium]|nr:hypothetical protein [Saprospiraceae bacterium]
DVTGLNPPFTYNWAGPNGFSDNQPHPYIFPASSNNQGTYIVTVTDDTGCFDTLRMDVYVHTFSSEGVVSDNTCGNSNGSIDVSVVGFEPYQFDWAHISGNDNAEDLSNLEGGDYNLTVTDANGCIGLHNFTVDVINGPSVTLVNLINEECGNSNGSIDLNITDESTISWSHGPTSEDVTGLSTGQYTVTVGNGVCETFAIFTIDEILPPTLSSIQNNSSCEESNGSINLTINGGTGPFTYDWAHIVGSDNVQNVSDLSAGSYSVTVSDANGCTDSIAVMINSIPILSFSESHSDLTCDDAKGSISLTINTGTPPFDIQWSVSEAHINDDSLNRFELDDGAYAVTITDAVGCSDSTSVILSNISGPSLTFDNSTNETCSADNGSINISISGDSSITWSNGANTEDINGLSAGTYYVTATNNICEVIDSFTIIDIISPTLSATSTHATCNLDNGSIDLSISNGTAPFTYDWEHIAGTDDGQDIGNIGEGTYAVTVSDANGCTDSIAVVINTTPILSFSESHADPTCDDPNGSISLTIINGTAPFDIQWSEPQVHINDDSLNRFGLDDGAYSVTITDAAGCSDSTFVILNSIIEPSIQPNISHSTHCNSDDGAIDLTIAEGTQPFTFIWSKGGVLISNSNQEDQNNLEPAEYSVTLTDANGCTVSDTFDIIQNNIPDIVVIPISKNSCNEENNIYVSVSNGAPPFSFNWSKNGTPGYNSSEDLDSLEAGTYQVFVTDNFGCIHQGQPVKISELPHPMVSDSSIMPSCNMDDGEIFILLEEDSLINPYTFDWADLNGNNQPQNRSGLAPGQYEVTVSNGLNCSHALMIELQPSSVLTVSAIASHNACDNANGQVDIEINGIGPFTYAWSKNGIPDFSTDSIITNLDSGFYEVVVTDIGAAGCTANASVQVSQTIAPILSFTISHIEGSNKKGAIDLTVEGEDIVTYQWENDGINDSNDTEDITGLDEGMYRVTVEDINGCRAV